MVAQVGRNADSEPSVHVAGRRHGAVEFLDAVVVAVDLAFLTVEDNGDELPFGGFPAVYDVVVEVGIVRGPASMDSLVVVVPNHQLEAAVFVPPVLGGEDAMVVDVVCVARGYGVALVLEPHGGSEDGTEFVEVIGGRYDGAVAIAVLPVLGSSQDSEGSGLDVGVDLDGMVTLVGGVYDLVALGVVHAPATDIIGPGGTVRYVGRECGRFLRVAPQHKELGSLGGGHGIVRIAEVAVAATVNGGNFVVGKSSLVEADVVDHAFEAHVVSTACPVTDGHLVVVEVEVAVGCVGQTGVQAAVYEQLARLAREYPRYVMPFSGVYRSGLALYPVGSLVGSGAIEYVGLFPVAVGIPIPPKQDGVGIVDVVREDGPVARVVGAMGVELGPSRNREGGNLARGSLELRVRFHASGGIEADALAEFAVHPTRTSATRPGGVVVPAASVARLVARAFVQVPVGEEVVRTRDGCPRVGLERADLGNLDPDPGFASLLPIVDLVGQEGAARFVGEAEVSSVGRGYLRVPESGCPVLAELEIRGESIEVLVARVIERYGHRVLPVAQIHHFYGDVAHGSGIGGVSRKLEGEGALRIWRAGH